MTLVRAIFAALLVWASVGAAPVTRPAPDVVVLDQLVAQYQPVPFAHKTHAAMAEMWNGCPICHHRQPPGAEGAKDTIQACRICHEPSSRETDLHRPSLKGAYHRQCLNCHREWANNDSCEICHKALGAAAARATTAPSVDDIVGRIHPPIAEPQVKEYQARFTPAVGGKAIFRHKEHTTAYGLKCADCHHRDTCSDCHNGKARTIAHKPINPGRTWKDSHAPCVSCHAGDRCRHCHFDSTPPPPFEHRSTGQILDQDHRGLTCGQCHAKLKSKSGITCGGAACHSKDPTLAFPAKKPGPVVIAATAPAAPVSPVTQPTTRAIIRRIRR